jgi:hypothetical protein
MAKVIWTEPALGDLDAIADYRVSILYVMRSERRLRPRVLAARAKRELPR